MSSTAAEAAVTVTILTRLCVAIDSDWDMDVRVRSVFFLRFGFCDARINLKTAGQAARQPDPDALPVEVCPRSASHYGMGPNENA